MDAESLIYDYLTYTIEPGQKGDTFGIWVPLEYPAYIPEIDDNNTGPNLNRQYGYFIPEPPDHWFLYFKNCPKVEYEPGQSQEDYWSYNDVWIGDPWGVMVWETASVELSIGLKRIYRAAWNHWGGKCWLFRFNGETARWQKTSGVIEEPTVSSYNGGTVSNLRMKVNRYDFHRNNAAPVDYYTTGKVQYGNSKNKPTFWTN